MKYSIITPQFNSFELMDKYFDSLLHQTFKDFELVIVDDCSDDGSWEKLLEYVKTCPMKVTLLQSEKNMGPGNARNLGIDSSTGEWITFIDSDDWVPYDFLERVDMVIKKEVPNCLIFDYYTWLNGKLGVARSMYVDRSGMKTISECISYVRNHTIGKVYRRDLCKDVKYPKLRRCEDVAYVAQAIAACGNAYYLNEPLYFYRQRPTSLSNISQLDQSDMLTAFSILEARFLSAYPLEIKNKSITDLLYGAVLMMCKSGASNSQILEFIFKYETKYPEWWTCEIIKHVGTPKKVFLKFAHWHCVWGIKFLAYIHSLIIKRGA